MSIPSGHSFVPASRGTVLILGGVALLVGSLAASAALAPSIGGGGDARPLTLVGSQGGGPGWHEHGSVYLLNGTDIVWRESSADSYFDVTMTENAVLAGFMHGGYEACDPYESSCPRTGFRVIDPSPQPHVVYEYSFPVRTKRNSEAHDVERLASGGYLVTDMEQERIFEVRDGEVTWQWNASLFYDAPTDPTRTDWLHLNDVDVLGDGRYLVSIRNANQILVVERDAGVVEVINRDGSDANDDSCRGAAQLRDTDGNDDVRCGDPDVLNHQHNPQWLGEGAVLVADSENDRVVELHERNGTWRVAWKLARANGVPLHWPRDADRLPNGNTLVTDTLNERIVEVNRSGRVVWSYRTPRIPYEADRLPAGETVGGPTYEATATDGTANARVPLLSTLVVGVHAAFPATPYWFRETQLLLVSVSLLLVLAGGVLRVRH